MKSITEDDSDAEELAEQEVNIRRKSIQDLFDGYEMRPEKEVFGTNSVIKKSQSSSRNTQDSKVTRIDQSKDRWQTDRIRNNFSSSVASKIFVPTKTKASSLISNFGSPIRLDLKWRTPARNI